MVRNRGGNRFRYEYKCRSASAPRFRLINTERSGSSSVIVSPIIAANLVSYCADIAENLSITEREGNGIVATFRPRGLRLRGIVLPRFPSVSLQLVHFLNEKYPSIVGGWNVSMFRGSSGKIFDGVDGDFSSKIPFYEKWYYSLMQEISAQTRCWL